ncbi:hypothetical protein Pyn_33125 [Prunus yedoensis var. nudiflora]|uniref:Uncharacterized protein n=1 Tax=Prunus yedoensis var. nudiflora TaxID=2094558 RepID=A0A314Z6B3_PRUYE|nr:hypothetical protein Pyn_33125 [Prunus yedoensis var. nudiflora]
MVDLWSESSSSGDEALKITSLEETEVVDSWKISEDKACDIGVSIFGMGGIGKVTLHSTGCRRELGVVLQRVTLTVFSEHSQKNRKFSDYSSF